jgi:hypothetical protein
MNKLKVKPIDTQLALPKNTIQVKPKAKIPGTGGELFKTELKLYLN